MALSGAAVLFRRRGVAMTSSPQRYIAAASCCQQHKAVVSHQQPNVAVAVASLQQRDVTAALEQSGAAALFRQRDVAVS